MSAKRNCGYSIFGVMNSFPLRFQLGSASTSALARYQMMSQMAAWEWKEREWRRMRGVEWRRGRGREWEGVAEREQSSKSGLKVWVEAGVH